jgi:hypothetical protein
MTEPSLAPEIGTSPTRIVAMEKVTNIDVHVEEVAGAVKTIDVVVDVFNRLNRGGTNSCRRFQVTLIKVRAVTFETTSARPQPSDFRF